MLRDAISPSQIALAMRRVLLRQVFTKELCKITGAESPTMAVSERPQMNGGEARSLVSLDGERYVVIARRA